MDKMRNVVGLLLLVTVAASSAACASAAGLGTPQLQENVSVFSDSVSNESGIVGQACRLIDQGKFEDAGKLIKQNSDSDPNRLDQASRRLLQIVDGYQDISQKMKQVRDEAYAQRMAELDKLRTKSDANNVGDVNDVNDITAALSAIANVLELADRQQKEKVLSDQFVRNMMQRAVDKASQFEVEGKWLEAYINCYAWLAVIDPNNEGYSDYAQRIYDKATIKASLEDSACETRDERYEGVEKQIFVETVKFLDRYYVNKIEFEQMAAKAVGRCRLLAEVMEFPPDDLKKQDEYHKSEAEYRQSLSAWSTALGAILDNDEKPPKAMTMDEFLEVFEKVLKLNETTVGLPQTLLIAHFAEASLAALDDYTVIIWPRQVQEFEKLMTNEFSGIGIEISKPKGLLTVSSLLPDTPAYKSGLDAGDIIEAVDGIPTKDMTLTCAVKKITGPKGTQVQLTIKRPGDENARIIVITRGKIVVPTIRGWQRTDTGQWQYMIDPENKIGYVRITSFSSDTASDLETVLDELEDRGLKGLILDLRYNSGGLLESAVDVSDKFISEGLIVQRQSGFGRLPIYAHAKWLGTHPNYPLVVLVNSGSASASEIVAGALADQAHKRAILVGTRTHGKGSVQGITDSIGEGAQLKYTMAYYHLPSGQRVESREDMKKQGREDWGVGPNIVVELNSEDVKNMIDVQRANDVLVKADHKDGENKLEKYTLEETLAVDRQLAVGLLVVRSKLVRAEAFAKARSDS